MAEKTPQPNTPKLVVAHAKSLRISPRKMRLVTNLVKNMKATDAIVQLQFTNKKSAPMLIKLIKSAIAIERVIPTAELSVIGILIVPESCAHAVDR